jgi:hypothetical protein
MLVPSNVSSQPGEKAAPAGTLHERRKTSVKASLVGNLSSDPEPLCKNLLFITAIHLLPEFG